MRVFLLVAAGLVTLLSSLCLASRRGEEGGAAGPPPPVAKAGATSEREELVLPDVVRSGPGSGEDRREVPPAAPPPPTSASLRVRVVDRATGLPVKSEVELWELDLPEDEIWTAGDRLHARVDIPADGLVFEDVPLGRYRAHPRARRLDGEDPPEFRVAAPGTEVDLVIDLPRRQRVFLEVFDERGRRVERSRWSTRYSTHSEVKTPFAEPRRIKNPSVILIGGGGAGGGFGTRSQRVGERGLFDLGLVRNRDCRGGASRSYSLRPQGRSTVDFELRGFELDSGEADQPPDGELIYVGVALPAGWFDDAILLPDGSRARDHDAEISVCCEAVERDALHPLCAWLDVPVRVTVELAGYEPLAFAYTLAEGEPIPRLLRPSPPPDRR